MPNRNNTILATSAMCLLVFGCRPSKLAKDGSSTQSFGAGWSTTKVLTINKSNESENYLCVYTLESSEHRSSDFEQKNPQARFARGLSATRFFAFLKEQNRQARRSSQLHVGVGSLSWTFTTPGGAEAYKNKASELTRTEYAIRQELDTQGEKDFYWDIPSDWYEDVLGWLEKAAQEDSVMTNDPCDSFLDMKKKSL